MFGCARAAELRAPSLIFAVLVALLGGCAEREIGPPPVEARGPAAFPEAHYRRLLAQGQPVFRVDTARSSVVVEVRRAGTLARFGHDHVVASRDLAGYVAPNEGRADLRLPLDALVVDDPALRAEAGLDTTPSAEDIAGTRRNMLEKVLEADRFPDALIAVSDLGPGTGTRRLRVTVTLHGATVPTDVAAQVDMSSDEITVSGTLALDQSSFGIAPFSILGGAIAVQDRVTMHFKIRARRIV
jgi:hypothetical protein